MQAILVQTILGQSVKIVTKRRLVSMLAHRTEVWDRDDPNTIWEILQEALEELNTSTVFINNNRTVVSTTVEANFVKLTNHAAFSDDDIEDGSTGRKAIPSGIRSDAKYAQQTPYEGRQLPRLW